MTIIGWKSRKSGFNMWTQIIVWREWHIVVNVHSCWLIIKTNRLIAVKWGKNKLISVWKSMTFLQNGYLLELKRNMPNRRHIHWDLKIRNLISALCFCVLFCFVLFFVVVVIVPSTTFKPFKKEWKWVWSCINSLSQWWRILPSRRCGFDPWVGRSPGEGNGKPTPEFLPGEFHEQRSIAGYSSWGCKELNMT